MGYLNFSWVLEGSLAGAEGPKNRRDLMFLKLQDITAVIRMEEQTISGESMEMADLYEPVPDFNPPKLEQIERMVKWIDEQIETWEHRLSLPARLDWGGPVRFLLAIWYTWATSRKTPLSWSGNCVPAR